MSYASPTNNFDFESLFLEEEQQVPNFYQSPTESLLSTSSSGTDHTNSSNEQQITYDVISDGYVFGNEFDVNGQKPTQKGLKQDDLAAANPFFNQTNNQFSSLNPLNNFLYNQNQKQQGFVGYQNPQMMGQLGMYFPHTFPNVFPQFGNQPFPFPNNTLLYTSPNTSPIGLTSSPNSNNSTGANPTNTSTNSTTSTATTQPTETKTKASRRKSAKKNTKSNGTTISATAASTTTPSSATSSKTEENTTSTTTPSPEQKSTKTPEPSDSDISNQSSEKEENDSSSSSGKKSEEKKRKRKSKKDAKALTPEEEKELKRQRRLIKNRESAQASRERKKIYIQGLEKKVDGLAQEFNELQGHVVTLEEENELLRQRLKMLGEVVEEPTHKKRKMVPMTSSGQMKVPIPVDSRSFVNPFMLDFWSLFGMQQQFQQAQPTPDLAQLNPKAASSSRRVVMFIMLFCVAMFLVLPHSSDIKFDSQTATSTTPNEQTESVTSRLSPASRKLASTDHKETMVDVSIDASQKPLVDEDFKKNVAQIYQAFQQVRTDASDEDKLSEESSDKPIIEDLASRINVVFDTDKVSLSFPKSILVKKEEDEMVDEDKFANSTYDEKISTLSTQLLKEICRVVSN